MEFVMVVLLGRITRDRSSQVTIRPRGSWTLFIQICVDRCMLLLSVGFHTLSHSLMTTLFILFYFNSFIFIFFIIIFNLLILGQITLYSTSR
jgi:hypothetical protein